MLPQPGSLSLSKCVVSYVQRLAYFLLQARMLDCVNHSLQSAELISLGRSGREVGDRFMSALML